jgi:DNA polymerase-3 subunit gamma/tau
MLRTHGELGYKQEQRFLLELGLLKLVHAQRLLPLEELLSGEVSQVKTGVSGSSATRPAAGSPRTTTAAATRASIPSRSASGSEAQSSGAPAASPFAKPSPFEADRSRKSEPKAEATNFAASNPSSVAAALSDTPFAARNSSAEDQTSTEGSTATAVAIAPDLAVDQIDGELSPELARNAVLAALEDAGQQVLAHNLEGGEWSVRGAEVAVTVAMSQVLIDVALGPEPKRIIQGALSKIGSRSLKFKMVSGVIAVPAKTSAPRPSNGVGARSRAMADPLVQRMQEKFGAEIRTVIDQKDRG